MRAFLLSLCVFVFLLGASACSRENGASGSAPSTLGSSCPPEIFADESDIEVEYKNIVAFKNKYLDKSIGITGRVHAVRESGVLLRGGFGNPVWCEWDSGSLQELASIREAATICGTYRGKAHNFGASGPVLEGCKLTVRP